MKITNYRTLVRSSHSGNEKYARVYEDKKDLRYIKEKGAYKCIENTPSINFMFTG